jgi:hypothetical protein
MRIMTKFRQCDTELLLAARLRFVERTMFTSLNKPSHVNEMAGSV